MAEWITRLEVPPGDGPLLAVKDAIDVEGVPTTAGCAAVADTASPAAGDADCVAKARAAGARIAGKTNLHELCFGTHGGNKWFGNPVNPVAPDRLVGGSSSGSAVAVATAQADVGYGTDTGGSVRLPAACCGLAGLKTTFGRISTAGVWPLSPSLDTVGPLARDVGGVVKGMGLLEPGFSISGMTAATVVGRIRRPGVDPALEDAVDRVLAASEVEVVDVDLPGWDAAGAPFFVILLSEAWTVDRHLYETAPERMSDEIRARLELGRKVDPAQVPSAVTAQAAWQREVMAAFDRVQVFAMPTLPGQPPPLDADAVVNSQVSPWNVSGNPALALPIPVRGWAMPGSIQLVGPHAGEEMLCATGLVIEEAVAAAIA